MEKRESARKKKGHIQDAGEELGFEIKLNPAAARTFRRTSEDGTLKGICSQNSDEKSLLQPVQLLKRTARRASIRGRVGVYSPYLLKGGREEGEMCYRKRGEKGEERNASYSETTLDA